MAKLQSHLSDWQTKALRLQSEELYGQQFREEDRVDRNVANKVLKFSNPLFQANSKKPQKRVKVAKLNKTTEQPSIDVGGGSVTM